MFDLPEIITILVEFSPTGGLICLNRLSYRISLDLIPNKHHVLKYAIRHCCNKLFGDLITSVSNVNPLLVESCYYKRSTITEQLLKLGADPNIGLDQAIINDDFRTLRVLMNDPRSRPTRDMLEMSLSISNNVFRILLERFVPTNDLMVHSCRCGFIDSVKTMVKHGELDLNLAVREARAYQQKEILIFLTSLIEKKNVEDHK